MTTLRRLAVLVAAHDRRDKTVACMHALQIAAGRLPGWDWQVFLADDGSADGTARAARAVIGERLHVLRGDGTWFWAASMAVAESAASSWRPDALLWLNDDVELEPHALELLLAEQERLPAASVVAGAVSARSTGEVTYAGFVRRHRSPLKLTDVAPAGAARRIDTFTGNAVLVSRAACEAVGPLDGGFSHAYADIDYGLRATAAGVSVVLAGACVGHCEANPVRSVIYDSRVPLRQRWRAAMNRRGIPWASQRRLYRRHGGPAWPVLYAASYLRVLVPPRAPATASSPRATDDAGPDGVVVPR